MRSKNVLIVATSRKIRDGMTPVGGIPDIVEDGIQGLLFTVGDSEKLAQALDKY